RVAALRAAASFEESWASIRVWASRVCCCCTQTAPDRPTAIRASTSATGPATDLDLRGCVSPALSSGGTRLFVGVVRTADLEGARSPCGVSDFLSVMAGL